MNPQYDPLWARLVLGVIVGVVFACFWGPIGLLVGIVCALVAP